ncbi:MAG: serine protease, partial [Spirulinaceae cyanobacterium]
MRKLTTHFLSLLLGVVLTFGTIRVLSSVAAPNATENSLIPAATKIETVKEIAQVPKAAIRPGGSFVSAAVERTGDAVVRIDTERTVTQRLDPLLQDPFFRDFFGDRFGQQAPQERTLRGQG